MPHETDLESKVPAEAGAGDSWVDRKVDRRQVLAGAAGLAVAALGSRALAQADPTTVPGHPADELGERAPSEMLERQPWINRPHGTLASLTPHGDLDGIITPSDLHYEIHHLGIPQIDPDRYELLIHGMVDRPTVFTLDQIRRFPGLSRINFMECSGNSLIHILRGPAEDDTAQLLNGLSSCSEWVGVPMATIMREVGVQSGATWALFEGSDGTTLSRSVPTEELWWGEAMLAYGQNGEALRPSQGYPLRLIVPGTEGNLNIKWLRRIEFGDRPWHTRFETGTYSDVRRDDDGNFIATQFTLRMDAKSIITWPSGGQSLPGAGFWEIKGLAWSGRGHIDRVEVSTDGGATWALAKLDQPVLPKAFTRFRFPWHWDGSENVIVSRAFDSTGYVQPTRAEMLSQHGSTSTFYHNNSQFRWKVNADGSVTSGDMGS